MSTRVKPATGKSRWLSPCPNTGVRRLRIQAATEAGLVVTVYAVCRTLGGFNLVKLGVTDAQRQPCFGPIRHIECHPSGEWSCDCEDARRRRKYTCKHVRGLRAALERAPF